MRSKRIGVSTTQVKVGVLTGGVKENKPQLELNMGDLLKGLNYHEVDGQYNGYRSMSGYEVYDGTALASSVVVPVTEVEGVVTYNDAAREAKRATITAVGGSGASGSVLGCYQDDNYVLAVRNSSAGTNGKLWKTTAVGWEEVPGIELLSYTSGSKNSGTKMSIGQIITAPGVSATIVAISTEGGSWDSGDASGYIAFTYTSGTFTSGIITGSLSATANYTKITSTLKPGGSYKFVQGRFDLLPGLQREKITFMASSSYYPSYIANGRINPILSHNLPDNFSTGLFATSIVEFKNRLWLGYPDGRLIFSNVGNPLDFDPTTFSGVIQLEDKIVDLRVVTGDVLVVLCENSIQTIQALSVGDATATVVSDYLFSNSTLTTTSGCVSGSAHRIFDDLIYIDERGLTSLEATEKFGNFETKSYSKNIQRTLSANISNIVGSYVDSSLNQYRIFFSDGFGIIFTFSMISNKSGSATFKSVKGATTFRYLIPISCVGDKIFGSTNGYLYKTDSGTSFNGEEIQTQLNTAYYHYQSPSFIKRFREIYFDGIIPFDLQFLIKANFDYRDTKYVSSTVQDELIVSGGAGSSYGEGVYDVMRYSSSESQTSVYYVSSFGTNMSVFIKTSNKYVDPHTLSSMIVQYSVNGRKM